MPGENKDRCTSNPKTKKLIIIVACIFVIAAIVTTAIIIMLSHRETVGDVLALGDRYMSEMDYESAIREYRRAIEIDPKSEDAYLKLADAYIAIGDIDSAIETLEDGYEATQSERILERLNELRNELHTPEHAKKLAVATEPDKLTYYVGDMLDLSGLTLKVTYKDGMTEEISEGYTCDIKTLETAGEQKVTVTYGGKTATFDVTVNALTLTGISIKTLPTKTKYYVRDKLDTSGLTLITEYSEGKTETVTSGFTCSPTELNTAGTQKITVTYGEKTAIFDVTVMDIQSIPAKDFTWTLENGVLTLSGHGLMPDYNSCPWYGEIERVVINYGILNIGSYAFENCASLTSITIPDSVTSIGSYAFSNCSNLTYITLPNSVTSISWCAFQGCSGLTSITIPGSVTSIEDWAFWNCTGLTSITIPDSVISIEYGAFYNCSGLKEISVGKNNPNYCSAGGVLFSKDMKTLITCPAGMSENYEIPSSVTSIKNSAFRSCGGLTSITIPDSVTSIGYEAFSGCYELTSITIPDSVTSIGIDAFTNCPDLTIHGHAGSYAEQYAKDNDIPFVAD